MPTTDAPSLDRKNASIAPATLAPVALSKQIVACLAAWLIPGLGHGLLGRYGRAVLIGVSIYTMAGLGLLMRGHLYSPIELDDLFSFRDILSKVCLIGQMGIGVLQPILRALGVGVSFDFRAATYEYGTYFLVVAGLLNYLTIFDVFDIAKGRKS
ncbi:MAG: DUF6677 family protein [Chloracidobacterium sp.]|uniref:DUF6677 domain-containing protein n=1 Tax=Chloracidobacterium validum TaxID=2821543 RepID=A0ABX8B5R9_9BACT|nr:DUF6677 family protein [Chloracidobacterium validum]QUW01999.1 hypothetical protein J8C06_06375 [Chloracidobacterium validum]